MIFPETEFLKNIIFHEHSSGLSYRELNPDKSDDLKKYNNLMQSSLIDTKGASNHILNILRSLIIFFESELLGTLQPMK